LTILVGNDRIKDWLGHRLKETIERTLSGVAGEAMTIAVEVGEPVVVATGMGNGAGAAMPQQPTNRQPPPPEFDEIDRSYGRKDDVPKRDAVLVNGQTRTVEKPPARAAGNGRVKDLHGAQQGAQDEDETVHFVMSEDDLIGRSFLITPHYAMRFIQPMLGRLAWSVLLTIQSFKNYAPHSDPKLKTIMLTVGISNKKAFDDALDLLEEHGLLRRIRDGRGRAKYRFELYDFRILTSKQHYQYLSGQVRDDHIAWLKKFEREGHFDMTAWENDEPRERWFAA
jgi:hypothetical protein